MALLRIAAMALLGLSVQAIAAPEPSTTKTVQLAIRVDGGQAAPSVAVALESLRSRQALPLQVIGAAGTPAETVAQVLGWPQDTVRLRMARLLCDLNRHVCCPEPPKAVADKIANEHGLWRFSCKDLARSASSTFDPPHPAVIAAWTYCGTDAAVSSDTVHCSFRFWNRKARLRDLHVRAGCEGRERGNDELCVPQVQVIELLDSIEVPVSSLEESLVAARRLTGCEGWRSGSAESEGQALCNRYANSATLNAANGGSLAKLLDTSTKDVTTGKVPVQIPVRGFLIKFAVSSDRAATLLTQATRDAIEREILARADDPPDSPGTGPVAFRKAGIYSLTTRALVQGASGEPVPDAPVRINQAMKTLGWGTESDRLVAREQTTEDLPAVLLYEPVGLQRVAPFLTGRVVQRPFPEYGRPPPRTTAAECAKLTFPQSLPGSLEEKDLVHAERVATVLVGQKKDAETDVGLLARLLRAKVWVAYEPDVTVNSFPTMSLHTQLLDNCLRTRTRQVPLVLNVSTIYPKPDAQALVDWAKRKPRTLFTYAAGNREDVRRLFKEEVGGADLSQLTTSNCPQQPACSSTAASNAISVVALTASGRTLSPASVGGPAFEVAAIGRFRPMDGADPANFSGTSFAAPLVAGLGALIVAKLQALPGEYVPSAADVKARILQTVDFSIAYGVRFGRINFDRALQLDRNQVLWNAPGATCQPAPSSNERVTTIIDPFVVTKWIDYGTDFRAFREGRLTIDRDHLLRISRACDAVGGYHLIYAEPDTKQSPKHILAVEIAGGPTSIAVGQGKTLADLYDLTICMVAGGSPVC